MRCLMKFERVHELAVSETMSMFQEDSGVSLDGTSLTPSSEMYSSTCSSELLQFREKFNFDAENFEESESYDCSHVPCWQEHVCNIIE